MSECSMDGGNEFVLEKKGDSVIRCLGLGCGYMMDCYKLEDLYFYNN